MIIPDFLGRDDYLQNPIMKQFLKNNGVSLTGISIKSELIDAIKNFADINEENKNITINFLKKVAKEGSKEFVYKKIKGIEEWHRNPSEVEAKINEKYPNCPRKNIVTYRNTAEQTLIDYELVCNSESGKVEKIEFVFSKLYLYGEDGTQGGKTAFPVFVDVYLNEGFVVGRAKAKSTLYQYDEQNAFLLSVNRIDTIKLEISLVEKIIEIFNFETENDKVTELENSKMLYKIYEKYTFTPDGVKEKVESQKDTIKTFVNQMFSELNLTARNKAKAMLDLKIFVEKFISINGDNYEMFKEDREAYLIKVFSRNPLELTSIDTASAKNIPLQCTEAFFDSKKSVVSGKTGKKLHMVFKRQNERFFSKANPLIVQFGMSNHCGYVKTTQYAEEVDIQNVLQAIFDNY